MLISDKIEQKLNHCLSDTQLNYPKKTGKARDVYDLGDQLLIVATDRLSASDRQLTTIPFKGQILNQLSAWWFRMSEHIIQHHLLRVPDAHSMLVKNCQPIPIEVVVRGFLTGSTKTSIWTLYKQGQREFFGHRLPDGMRKNEALSRPIVTPTTKDNHSDRNLSPDEICQFAGITTSQWDHIQNKALALFEFGQLMAMQRGLLLVDTKYEFGWDAQGNLCLIDELHTPDSSRYWPQAHVTMHYDKEIIREWYNDNSSPYKQVQLPEAPKALRTKMAERYIDLYERITGESFNGEPFKAENIKQKQLK